MIRTRFEALTKAFADDVEMLSYISDNMNRIVGYVKACVIMEYQMPIIHARYDGDVVREKIMDLDMTRRIKHDAAIAATSQLTRWAKMVNVEPVFDGDLEDRYAIADFCLEVVKSFFESSQNIDDHHKFI